MGLTQIDQTLLGEGWVYHLRPGRKGISAVKLWQSLTSFFRKTAPQNAFRYPIFHLLIPIHLEDSQQNINNRSLISLSSRDYLNGQEGSLKKNIESFLFDQTGESFDQIWLQTFPRLLGYVFNPVSFWYCYKGSELQVVLCEVNNTFGERHFYLLKNKGTDGNFQSQTQKDFHVSPFFAVSGHYSFEFSLNHENSHAQIKLYENGQLQLDTGVRLRLRPFAQVSTGSLLRKYGWLTVFVVLRIHMQALRLWLKGAKFFRQPPAPKERITYD